MSEYPKHVTCPLCGNIRAESVMFIVEWVAICHRQEGGCGNIWSLECGEQFDPQPPLSELPSISRRNFVIGALATPIAASAIGSSTAAIALPSSALAKPVNLVTASNMNSFQRWWWHFDLEQAADGSFTLVSQQVHDDPSDEPWEIEPSTGLRSGADIYHALNSVLGLVDGGMFLDAVDRTARALAAIDPRLADEFQAEALEYDFGDCGNW